ncbi:lysostaphin resistance A-like protein [Paenibacillus hodogayensis]|uniref:Lysostaphin resistance A-like protein n=1 Tax=Paenibacillus hodogayensis TaxID=279208 RepID=A0ABV5VSF5_9BACL
MEKTVQAAVVVGKIGLAFVMAFVLTLIGMIPVVAMLAVGQGDGADGTLTIEKLVSDPTFVYGSTIAQAVGFIAAVPLMYALFERRNRWPIGWKKRGATADLLRGAMMGIVLMSAIFAVMWIGGAVRIVSFSLDAPIGRELAAYVLFFALVSLNEELFSRGYVQGLIRHRFGAIAAVGCSSLFFALMHAFNPGALAHPLPLFNIWVAGILLGICREVSGSLWLPIGLHWTWNYVQGNIFGFEVSGTKVIAPLKLEPLGSSVWSGGSFGAEGSLIATVVMATAIWYLWIRSSKRRGIEAK